METSPPGTSRRSPSPRSGSRGWSVGRPVCPRPRTGSGLGQAGQAGPSLKPQGSGGAGEEMQALGGSGVPNPGCDP